MIQVSLAVLTVRCLFREAGLFAPPPVAASTVGGQGPIGVDCGTGGRGVTCLLSMETLFAADFLPFGAESVWVSLLDFSSVVLSVCRSPMLFYSMLVLRREPRSPTFQARNIRIMCEYEETLLRLKENKIKGECLLFLLPAPYESSNKQEESIQILLFSRKY